jgi:Acyl-CoA dehydrogenase, C-terminal domain
VRFDVAPELELFAESICGVLAGWEPSREIVLGEWTDSRDDDLAARLAELGWAELWVDQELLGATVAGAVELGRAVAPLHLLDEATLGAPLAVGRRVRHGAGRPEAAFALHSGGLALGPIGSGEREPSLDSVGTLVVAVGSDDLSVADAAARWRAWIAATVAYLAGLADDAVAQTVEHVRSREQFGASLAALPAMQAKLADAALARDGLLLAAWSLAAGDADATAVLAWAGGACREVTVIAQQAHGAIGFALESGLHRAYRRAKTVQVWADAVSCEIAALARARAS